MTTVNIKPMPESYKKIKPLYRPGIPPIFTNIDECGITEQDRQCARELFALLDDESKNWYTHGNQKHWLLEPFEKLEKSKKSKNGRKRKVSKT